MVMKVFSFICYVSLVGTLSAFSSLFRLRSQHVQVEYPTFATVENEIDSIAEQTRKMIIPTVTRIVSNVPDSAYGAKVASVEEAKHALLHLVPKYPDMSIDDHLRIEYLVKVMHGSHKPILTVPFLDLIYRGTWKKAYSNLLRPNICPDISFNITQVITGEETGQGVVLENVMWRFTPAAAEQVCTGALQVWSNYTYTSKGHILQSLNEHILLPESIPDDVEEFLLSLQGTIPFESFDPNGLCGEIMYADPELRVIKVTGSRFFDVINIFLRENIEDVL